MACSIALSLFTGCATRNDTRSQAGKANNNRPVITDQEARAIAKEAYIYGNSINRYLINSPMLPDLKRDAGGGLTLYLQRESPGTDQESNWLPAPNGPFMAVLRLYWPKEEAINGAWKQPPMQSAQ